MKEYNETRRLLRRSLCLPRRKWAQQGGFREKSKQVTSLYLVKGENTPELLN